MFIKLELIDNREINIIIDKPNDILHLCINDVLLLPDMKNLGIVKGIYDISTSCYTKKTEYILLKNHSISKDSIINYLELSKYRIKTDISDIINDLSSFGLRLYFYQEYCNNLRLILHAVSSCYEALAFVDESLWNNPYFNNLIILKKLSGDIPMKLNSFIKFEIVNPEIIYNLNFLLFGETDNIHIRYLGDLHFISFLYGPTECTSYQMHSIDKQTYFFSKEGLLLAKNYRLIALEDIYSIYSNIYKNKYYLALYQIIKSNKNKKIPLTLFSYFISINDVFPHFQYNNQLEIFHQLLERFSYSFKVNKKSDTMFLFQIKKRFISYVSNTNISFNYENFTYQHKTIYQYAFFLTLFEFLDILNSFIFVNPFITLSSVYTIKILEDINILNNRGNEICILNI